MPHDDAPPATDVIEYIIISTARSGRYHHNMLTCLAAPMGARVQYRYDARRADGRDQPGGGLMDPDMLSDPPSLVGRKALVCHLDVDKLREVAGDDGRATIDETFPIVPVREVHIRQVLRAGSVLTLELEIGRVPNLRASENGDALGTFRRSLSAFEGKVPQTADPDTGAARTKDGHLCFSVAPGFEVVTDLSSSAPAPEGPDAAETDPSTTAEQNKTVRRVLHFSTSIDAWESAVEALHATTSFREVPYFFTVVGAEKVDEKDTTQLRRWPDANAPFYVDEVYSVVFYIYHPDMDRHRVGPGHSLHLTTSPGVQIVGATDLAVDSSYDVRTVTLRITARLVSDTLQLDRTPHEWMLIGPRNPESAADSPLAEWSFQLDVPLSGHHKLLIWRFLLIGTALAVPTGLSLIGKVPGFVAFLFAALVGAAGAWANLAGVRKA